MRDPIPLPVGNSAIKPERTEASLLQSAQKFTNESNWHDARREYGAALELAPLKSGNWMKLLDIAWWDDHTNGRSSDAVQAIYAEARNRLGVDQPELNVEICHVAWCLLTGHQHEYEKVCKLVFDRHHDTERSRTKWQMSLILSLGNQSVVPPKQLVEMAREAIQADPEKEYFRSGLYISLIRAGEYKEALEYSASNAQNALCYAYMGNDHQARDFLRLAKEELDEHGTTPNSILNTTLRLCLQYYIHEAEKLLKTSE